MSRTNSLSSYKGSGAKITSRFGMNKAVTFSEKEKDKNTSPPSILRTTPTSAKHHDPIEDEPTQYQPIPDTPPLCESQVEEIDFDTQEVTSLLEHNREEEKKKRRATEPDPPAKKIKTNRSLEIKEDELISDLTTRLINCEKKLAISEMNVHDRLRDVAALRGEVLTLASNMKAYRALLDKYEQRHMVTNQKVESLLIANIELRDEVRDLQSCVTTLKDVQSELKQNK